MDKTAIVDVQEFDIETLKQENTKTKTKRKPRLDRPIQKIAIHEIVEGSPLQTRIETFNPERFAEDRELLESIRSNGVLEPIMVRRISDMGEDSRYRVVFGHRRLAASELAELKEIPSIIASIEDEDDFLTLVENTGGRELTAYERALSLTELSQQKSHVTVRELSMLTGIHFSSIADLLKAYRDSPPALRGLFAEGAGARTVVVLRKVFAKLDEQEHKKFAQHVTGISTRDAEKVQRMVEDGIDPFQAVKALLGEGKKQSRKAKADSEAKGNLDVGNTGQVEALALYTGANTAQVKRIAMKGQELGASLEEITIACAYRGNGGTSNNDLEMAKGVAKTPRLTKLIKRQLDHASRSRKAIETIEDQKLRKYVSTILNGAE